MICYVCRISPLVGCHVGVGLHSWDFTLVLGHVGGTSHECGIKLVGCHLRVGSRSCEVTWVKSIWIEVTSKLHIWMKGANKACVDGGLSYGGNKMFVKNLVGVVI
jgi:hypothetical protein